MWSLTSFLLTRGSLEKKKMYSDIGQCDHLGYVTVLGEYGVVCKSIIAD